MRAKIHDMDSDLYEEAQQMADVIQPILAELVQESIRKHDDPATGVSVGGAAIIFLATGLSDSCDEMLGLGTDKAAKRKMVEGLVAAINGRLTTAAMNQNGELN